MRLDRRRSAMLASVSLVGALLLSSGGAGLGAAGVSAAKPKPTPTPVAAPTPTPDPTPTPTPDPTPTPTPPPADPASKIRGDLAALVSGAAALDPELTELVPGYTAGEVPYFALLSEPFTGTHETALASLGVRVTRSYRTIDLVAVASPPAAVNDVAALPWVTFMAPQELVFVLEEPVEQTKGTTADVGAPAWWNLGVTGDGVRIAILDTGIDFTHPDLDDLDFKSWSSLFPHDSKVVESRDFNDGKPCLLGGVDGHGHGTHVAGIAAGTGEGGASADDNGKYAGIAPGAKLASGKVMNDAGAGNNADLIAAMEWAAMPAEGPLGCGVGADIVNMSLGSEARPGRLNSGSDIDLVSLMVNRLTVRYGTLFVASMGNSGPYIGSALESPGSASHAMSVGATAKDYDLNHDDTMSGNTCAGWRHPGLTCDPGVGDQPPSVASFSSRGPSGDVWLRPDVAAPGLDIVAPQASSGTQLAGNDQVAGTRLDPLYATASGTSMAAPAAAGSAALVLEAYRIQYGSNPSASTGVGGVTAGRSTLLRAALMNSAGDDLFESNVIFSIFPGGLPTCPPELAPSTFGFCDFITQFGEILGSTAAYHARNAAADPYAGPFAEGAGKVNVGRAIAALRNGVVAFSTASGSGAAAGTGPRDLQGTWQVGPVAAGATVEQSFVLHSAPGAARATVTFNFSGGHPSDGAQPIIPSTGPNGWTVTLPKTTTVNSGADKIVTFKLKVPASASAGMRTGVVVVNVAGVTGVNGVPGAGQTLRIPVFASVTLHDTITARNTSGPAASINTARDVFAKSDTFWPNVVGQPGTGSNADWLVYPVDIAGGLSEAIFTAWDTTELGNTYDLYVYEADFDLISSTHPFVSDGVTDQTAADARPPSTAAAPATVILSAPAAGRYYVALSRAKVGRNYVTAAGDFGSAALRLDEVR